MRRVALVSPYALSVPGGVQEQVLAMSRDLASRDVEVMILAPDDDDRANYDTPATLVRLGRLVAVPANGSRAPITLSWGASRRAARALEIFAPDVIHLHEPFAPALGYASVVAHSAPMVGTFHRSGGGPAYWFTRPVLRAVAARLDASVAVSQSAAATARRGAGVSATVLFNGFEIERFSLFDKPTNPEPLIVFVGRLEDRKGVSTLVDASRRDDAAVWRFVVIGDGPQRRSLEAQNAAGGRVEFLGALDDDDKRRWLARADVAVACSTHGESFGLVILEAMASSTRVVASDIDGYRDAAGGHAVMVAPGDPAALSAGIHEALATRDAATLSAALAHARRWSMSTLMDRYVEIYDVASSRFAASRSLRS